jgi:farnesyl-diphosphate farnesyltransferase
MLDLADLLQKTSRTFALAIPLLPEPARTEVGLAYLLFRIADTFEDATEWPRAQRQAALADFTRVLEQLDASGAAAMRDRWMASPPCTHQGYVELLGKTPEVISAVRSLDAAAQRILVRHAARTAEGMARIVMRSDEKGVLRLGTLEELRDYCYVVAGIVGELLTELFLNDAPQLESERRELEENTRLFGEGLQLVNILKDSAVDAGDGRTYLPERVPRSEVLELARRDLDAAGRYVTALQRGGAPRGYVAFTGLSVMLARASLDRLETAGAGAKVTREDVHAIFTRLEGALDRGDPVGPLLS